jgi:hypothetical protein
MIAPASSAAFRGLARYAMIYTIDSGPTCCRAFIGTLRRSLQDPSKLVLGLRTIDDAQTGAISVV